MSFRGKKPKKKTNSDNECYNYHIFGHFQKDSFLSDRELNRTTQQSQKKDSSKKNPRRDMNVLRNSNPNQAHQDTKNNKAAK